MRSVFVYSVSGFFLGDSMKFQTNFIPVSINRNRRTALQWKNQIGCVKAAGKHVVETDSVGA